MALPNDIITEDVDQNAYIKEESEFGVWADYRVTNKYINCPQVYMMPVTSPAGFQGTSVAFVQLASPTTALMVEWTACRWSSSPVIPDPNLFDPNWIILYKLPETVMKVLAADGQTELFRVNGTYVYGKKNPAANVYTDVSFPQPPWMEGGTSQNRTINPNKLEKGVIDSPTQAGGGGGNGQGLAPGGPIPVS